MSPARHAPDDEMDAVTWGPAALAGHHHRRGRQAGRLRQLLRSAPPLMRVRGISPTTLAPAAPARGNAGGLAAPSSMRGHEGFAWTRPAMLGCLPRHEEEEPRWAL